MAARLPWATKDVGSAAIIRPKWIFASLERLALAQSDPSIDSATADRLIAFIKSEQGPIKSSSDLATAGLSTTVIPQIQSLVTYSSKWYQVIAKVSYNTSSFFARAYLQQKLKGDYPDIASFELF